jgi:DNA-nicking Smr family endonuclease
MPANTKKYNTLIVITGKGNHINIDGSRGVLRKEIEIYLRNTLGIENVKPDPKNDGRLIISMII